MKSLLLFTILFLIAPTAALAAGPHAADPEFVTEMAKFPAMEKAKGIQGIPPFFPASGPATGFFNGLHPKSNFLAIG